MLGGFIKVSGWVLVCHSRVASRCALCHVRLSDMPASEVSIAGIEEETTH